MAKKVFVSGCYDMLHSGHVAFFKDAARLRGLVCRDRFRRDDTRVESEANGLFGGGTSLHGKGHTSREGCLY